MMGAAAATTTGEAGRRAVAIIMAAEFLGTLGLLYAAAGSIVHDGNADGQLGIVFIAAAHFVGLGAMIMIFGRYSMAHFNPAVTMAFWMVGRTRARLVPAYLAAQLGGALAGTAAVMYSMGGGARLGANYPGQGIPIHTAFLVEVLATAFLVGTVMACVLTRQKGWASSVSIAGAVALDVLFFGTVSGASMNPARSLAPAVFMGDLSHMWLYAAAPLIGAAVAGLASRRLQKRRPYE